MVRITRVTMKNIVVEITYTIMKPTFTTNKNNNDEKHDDNNNNSKNNNGILPTLKVRPFGDTRYHFESHRCEDVIIFPE